MQLILPPAWQPYLGAETQKPYFQELIQSLTEAYHTRTIYPAQEDIFRALKLTTPEAVQVVILGQDPYHREGQAHGLAFSVPDGIKIPPSLQNIYKEIKVDTGASIPTSGNLERWAHQGVLLLNTTLTVEASKAGSHQGWGWEQFTDTIIQTISQEKEQVVFLLWGAFAAKKAALIDSNEHLILSAPHPSPLSAYRGFFGCRHFSQANEFLTRHKKEKIIW